MAMVLTRKRLTIIEDMIGRGVLLSPEVGLELTAEIRRLTEQGSKTMSPNLFETLNRLAKWRSIFTSWQLGTRTGSDPEAQAVRDHREVTMVMRAEINAISVLLIHKGIITREEFDTQVCEEAEHLMRAYEERFPGAKATNAGMAIDMTLAHAWMSKFPP